MYSTLYTLLLKNYGFSLGRSGSRTGAGTSGEVPVRQQCSDLTGAGSPARECTCKKVPIPINKKSGESCGGPFEISLLLPYPQDVLVGPSLLIYSARCDKHNMDADRCTE